MLSKRSAYEKWLGIKEEHQPPNWYRLLSLDAFEDDSEIIANAVDSRMGFIRQFQSGEHAKVAAEILNELARARAVLLHPQKKAAYDAQLKASAASSSKATAKTEKSVPLRVAVPIGAPSAVSVSRADAVHEGGAEGRTAPESAELESFTIDPATKASATKQKTKARPPFNPISAVIAGAVMLAGCLAAAAIYVFVFHQSAEPLEAKNDPPKVDVPNAVPATSGDSKESKDTSTKAAAAEGKSTAKSATSKPKSEAPETSVVVPVPVVEPPKPYDKARLRKDLEEITQKSKTVKTPDDSRRVAEKAIALADRAIVLGKADVAKDIIVITLSAARSADLLPLARRATVLLILLRRPISDTLVQEAKKRIDAADSTQAVASNEERVTDRSSLGEPSSGGPSLDSVDGKNTLVTRTNSHDSKWGKTEDQRRKIFYDLLKAVDDHGMTPAGRKAWKEIQARNGIDNLVTLGILSEGFGAYSDWEQPDGGGKASTRMNRIEWVGERTRSMAEPMLKQ
jgi:hypothetical protein